MTYVGNNASGLRLYVDGVEDAIGPLSTTTIAALGGSVTDPFKFGEGTDGGRDLEGILDEVRVSTVARSADWIKASYLSQVESSTFASIGSEEA